MDNLQFRAWDKFWETMIQPQAIMFKAGYVDCISELDEGVSSVVYYDLMQATGFFDMKNKKRIFESDIVEVKTVRGEYYSVGIVKKHNGVFYLEHPITKNIIMMSDFYFKSYTDSLEMVVIGNIYENLDVLEDYIEGVE